MAVLGYKKYNKKVDAITKVNEINKEFQLPKDGVLAYTLPVEEDDGGKKWVVEIHDDVSGGNRPPGLVNKSKVKKDKVKKKHLDNEVELRRFLKKRLEL